jgi:DNA-nicking Smr family endonuclease
MSQDKTNDDEARFFAEAMRDVKRLHSDTIKPARRHLSPHPQQRHKEQLNVRRDLLSDAYDHPVDGQTGEELVYLRTGVQYQILRKLRRGHYSIQAELDLHGLFVSKARAAVTRFLHDCQHHHLRCARIVHGKGHGSPDKQPILKIKLNHWLRQYDAVLAFCSAPQTDGGTGAVHVLLKRHDYNAS